MSKKSVLELLVKDGEVEFGIIKEISTQQQSWNCGCRRHVCCSWSNLQLNEHIRSAEGSMLLSFKCLSLVQQAD